MKILFDYLVPGMLGHGGMLVQIRQTKAALETLGCEVEYVRWWDEGQNGDILHCFGRMQPSLIETAQRKGMRVVLAALLAAQGARPAYQIWLQRHTMRLMQRTLPRRVTTPFRWDAYRMADAAIALTPWEAHLLNYIFNVPREKIHLVPNGVEDVFLESRPAQRGPWLVCTATITEVKRVVELAQAAIRAQTPVWVIGKPYSEADAYAHQFFALAKAQPQFVRYEGPVQDRAKLAQIYREARGFVLLSTWESLSLSALEAAACGCPLLLSDLPWARLTFQDKATYCPIRPSPAATAPILRKFYEQAPQLPVPPKPLSWLGISQQLKSVYEALLRTSR